MKKILLSISVFIFCFSLVSCSSKGDSAPIPTTDRPFSSNLQISLDNLSYEGFLTFQNGSNATLEITKPDSLSSLIFTLSNGELSAKYEGLSFPLSSLDSNAKSAVEMIFSAIASAGVSNNVQVNEAKGEFTVSGKIYSYKYDMIFDRMSGAIKSFSVPSESLFVTFTNFKFLG